MADPDLTSPAGEPDAHASAELVAEETCIQMVVGHWPNVTRFERGLIEVYGSEQARRIIKALERRKADLLADLAAVEHQIRGKGRGDRA